MELGLAQNALPAGTTMFPQSPMDRIVDRLTDGQMAGWTAFFTFVLCIVVVSKTASTIKAVARERTRREIAAFIAEGSISAEQGERLMKAGRSAGEC